MNSISIDSFYPGAHNEVEKYLSIHLKDIIENKRPIIFLCIGTDRSSGDSLGPLVGYKLKSIKYNNFYIYGSLENPIHSINLDKVRNRIISNFNNPFIVAIDSCLGSPKNVGKIIIEEKPLYPGAALNKQLNPIGDIRIVGVVNIVGESEFIILQNTRLYTVMNLADIISKGISSFIINNSKKKLLDIKK